MNSNPVVELSVVIAAPHGYPTIRKTIGFLRAQMARERLEIVIVVPTAESLGSIGPELREFGGVRIVAVGEIRSIGGANAAGIRQAGAAIVALAEDHAFPEPGWAAALIAAHRDSCAAVGPVVLNGNPRSLVSWADFLIGYGPWRSPQPAGEREFLPGHNSSYKRDLLLGYGAALDVMLESETVLHWDLRAKGHRLRLEAQARIAHVNFSRAGAWMRAQFHGGRVFAARRAQLQNWSLVRRLLFAGGAPLIPAVRLWRLIRQNRRGSPDQPSWVRLLPLLMLGLLLDGAGQLLGSAFGLGAARTKLAGLEFDRYRHLNRRDQQAW
jgi:hypothetical protein